jgi:hypothetical protein
MALEPLGAAVGARPVRLPPPPPRACAPELPAPQAGANSRRRDLLGWLGILAGAAVFVAALVVALAMGLRGGRLILAV